MNWKMLKVSADRSHHVDTEEIPAYTARFDEVLKFHAPGLAPVSKGRKAWHIHVDGTDAYDRRFTRTFGFYEGLAAVENDGQWFHITPDGLASYNARYAWCGNFQAERCTVRQTDGKYLHMTSDGQPAYRERWRYAGDYRDGLAVVQAEDGHSTHIDLFGKQVHGRWYLDLDVFHKGYARARDKAGWMHIDSTGRPLYTHRFASVEPFYNGQARVERFDGGLQVIDESGNLCIELRPAIRTEFSALSADMVGFWKTQSISAAVELGIFEQLPSSTNDISKNCGLRHERTHRLMRALAELSLAEHDGDVWKLTKRGEYLRKENPTTLAGAAREYGYFFPNMWQALSEAMKEKSTWSSPKLFDEVAHDAERREEHHQMLLSYARHDYVDLPRFFALHGNESVIDAGGGLGGLASALVDHYPEIHVTLYERPEVIAQATTSPQLSTRIAWHVGDLFEPWGLKADVVILARVLHDWNDADAMRILRRARGALSSGGKLFVAEMLLSEDNAAGSLCDLHLLMATGGQERTAAEYAFLMDKAGFALTETRQTTALPSLLVGVAR